MNKKCTFEFEETADPRKGFPYIAIMRLKDNDLDREFINLTRIWGKKNTVTVTGDYEANHGDILEMQTGGSWKNKYREFYAVVNCELVWMGDATSSKDKVKVLNYLKGKIALADLDTKIKEKLDALESIVKVDTLSVPQKIYNISKKSEKPVSKIGFKKLKGIEATPSVPEPTKADLTRRIKGIERNMVLLEGDDLAIAERRLRGLQRNLALFD